MRTVVAAPVVLYVRGPWMIACSLVDPVLLLVAIYRLDVDSVHRGVKEAIPEKYDRDFAQVKLKTALLHTIFFLIKQSPTPQPFYIIYNNNS